MADDEGAAGVPTPLIIVTGPPASGKTALARRLADEAGVAGIAFHPRHASQQHKGAPDYRLAAELAEAVEAWSFRRIQRMGEILTREEVALAWFTEEYKPLVDMLADAGLLGSGTEAEAYLRVSAERYRLLRTHTWNEEILERLRPELR